MHENRWRLGLRQRPHWGSLQRSPDPLAGLRRPTSKGRGREWRGREGKGGEGRGGRDLGPSQCCRQIDAPGRIAILTNNRF